MGGASGRLARGHDPAVAFRCVGLSLCLASLPLRRGAELRRVRPPGAGGDADPRTRGPALVRASHTVSAALVLLGIGLGATAVVSALRVRRVQGWPRVVAAVSRSTPRTPLAIGSGPAGARMHCEVVVRYAVAQTEYVARVRTAGAPDRRLTLHYNPENPNEVVPGRPGVGWPVLWGLAAAAALATWWRAL